jgi:uncharacterized repeat protein (TIGR02543 family)
MKTFTVLSLCKRVLPLLAALALPAAALAQTLPTAPQVAARIRVGYNVGNSLEVPGGETLWGNPPVNLALVTAAKNAGFNAVRLPCSWDSHADQATMTIDPAWLARVKEVVDYAVGQGMYVIINGHWDGGWLEEHPLFSYQTAVNAKQQAYWTQIANFFKSYDEHLLFAGTNEVHADYGTPTAEHNSVQQSYNQTFVTAVRATGGNNATRPLVVQTYNTNIKHGLDFFNLPTDSASNRLIVEVHYYDPYDFTLNQYGSCLYWGAPYPAQSNCTWAYETYVDTTFAQVNAKWVAAGVPVIIGEYGVATRSGLDLGARAYYLTYVNKAATRNGIKTFYWDNGVTGTNGFALFDRTTGAIVDQAALDAVLAGVGNPNVNYTVTTSVNGSGTVTRSPTGTSLPGGTTLTLTATPAAGYDFAGWTGELSGATNPISFTVTGNATVTANFVLQGTGGTGRILREYWTNIYGASIAGLTSSAAYPNSPTGSEQLTSIEGPNNFGDAYGTRIRGYVHPLITGAYTFWIASDDVGELWVSTSADPAGARKIAYVDGYAGPREWGKYASQKSAAVNLVAGQKYYIEVLHVEGGGGDNVAVAWQGPGMQQAIPSGSYISPFVPTTGTTFALTVAKAGTGAGTVTSSVGGVNCGTTCSATLASGTAVTLTATAASGSTFGGWSGACTGTSSCVLTMTAARAVTATFTATNPTYTLTVNRSGTGSGTVTSSAGGINCGTTCSATFTSGAVVTLTAAATAGSTFGGWSNGCTGTTPTCTVSMTAARTVTATFTGPANDISLGVTRAGTGTGTVTSTPSGINCGTVCSSIYASGTVVTLTATAASGSTFAGWSGSCTGTAATCTVTMSTSRAVTATFNGTGSTPCANPVAFATNTGNFNTTGAVCYRTSQTVNGWGCSNFTGRTVSVNGGTATATCGAGPFPITKSSDGYTYFAATAGTYPWASIYIW